MTRTAFTLILCFMFTGMAGCLDGDSGSGSNTAKIGRLTLTGIEGLRYETQSQSGLTNSRGEFRYYDGENISFWIGDLQIAENVPAKPFLTPIDFSQANRELLNAGTSDRYGLSTHLPLEERLARESVEAVNITRLLLVLDEDRTERLGDEEDPRNNIRLSERMKEQLNAALAVADRPIDFSADITDFAAVAPNSPVNALLSNICFFPADDRRCDPVTGLEEIEQKTIELAAITAQIENDEPYDEVRQQELTQRLQELRERNQEIINARRSLSSGNIEAVETFLVAQTRRYNSSATRDYYVTPFEVSVSAADTAIKTLQIHTYQNELDLTGLDAISTNDSAIVVPRWDTHEGEVDFYVAGEAGAEGEVRLSFRPNGDYRWFQFQVRPLIE